MSECYRHELSRFYTRTLAQGKERQDFVHCSQRKSDLHKVETRGNSLCLLHTKTGRRILGRFIPTPSRWGYQAWFLWTLLFEIQSLDMGIEERNMPQPRIDWGCTMKPKLENSRTQFEKKWIGKLGRLNKECGGIVFTAFFGNIEFCLTEVEKPTHQQEAHLMRFRTDPVFIFVLLAGTGSVLTYCVEQRCGIWIHSKHISQYFHVIGWHHDTTVQTWKTISTEQVRSDYL